MTVSTNCITATFRRSSAKATRCARRPAVDELYTEDCVLYVPPGRFIGRGRWHRQNSSTSILASRFA